MKWRLILLVISVGFVAHSQNYFERTFDVPVNVGTTPIKNAWVGGLNSVQLSDIDLDFDGDKDLFVFDRATDQVYTFINNSGTYVYDSQYESRFPKMNSWALLRDYNCDGKEDIFTYYLGGIQVWENTSNATDGIQFELVVEQILSKQRSGNMVNLYVSSVDIPAIDDIDGDGDLDVLTFGILGTYLEYNKNLSVENNGDCSALEFEVFNYCWGHFSESGSGTNEVFLNDVCSDNVTNPERNGNNANNNSDIKKHGAHSGSTVLSFDVDGNGVKDLLLGDASFNSVVMLRNDDIGVNANSAMVEQDVSFPSYDVPIDVNIFPATFYVDVTNDGVKDLIISPNNRIQSENKTSVYLYVNNGTNDVPVFAYSKNNFLQEDMIDVGSASFPVPFDYNRDGVMDLIVANYGDFDKVTSQYQTKLALFENTGTITSPEFTLIDDDYLELSTLGFTQSVYPSFGDLDNDGDLDLIVGDAEGILHYFQNTGGAGVANFVLDASPLKDAANLTLDVGIAAYPFLYDLDNDGDLDLVIGERNGNLNHYDNIGTPSNHSFKYITDTLGKINVNEDGYIVGHSIPFLFKNANGNTQLFVGSERGMVHYYSSIDGNLTGTFALSSDNVDGINIGYQSAPALYDFDNDGKLDMILGNLRGGLAYYKGKEDLLSINNEHKLNVELYPNPNSGSFTIELPENAQFKLYSVEGKLLHEQTLLRGVSSINTSLPSGIYFVEVISNSYQHYRDKIVVR